MPEWCYNRLSVRGSKASVNRFVAAVQGYEPLPDERGRPDLNRLCLNNIVPVPARLLGGRLASDGRAGPSPDEALSAGELSTWQEEAWGCVWGTTNVSVQRLADDEVAFDFCTPWEPPLPFVMAASKRFRSLDLLLKYEQPNDALHGALGVKAGIVWDEFHLGCGEYVVQGDAGRGLSEVAAGRGSDVSD